VTLHLLPYLSKKQDQMGGSLTRPVMMKARRMRACRPFISRLSVTRKYPQTAEEKWYEFDHSLFAGER
jgi:hypothetical protein